MSQTYDHGNADVEIRKVKNSLIDFGKEEDVVALIVSLPQSWQRRLAR